MNAKNGASSSDESANRCDDMYESDDMNAVCETSGDDEKANRGDNLCENDGDVDFELGTGRVVCSSIKDCEVQNVKRQRAN